LVSILRRFTWLTKLIYHRWVPILAHIMSIWRLWFGLLPVSFPDFKASINILIVHIFNACHLIMNHMIDFHQLTVIDNWSLDFLNFYSLIFHKSYLLRILYPVGLLVFLIRTLSRIELRVLILTPVSWHSV
jgi:hypothetical protein